MSSKTKKTYPSYLPEPFFKLYDKLIHQEQITEKTYPSKEKTYPSNLPRGFYKLCVPDESGGHCDELLSYYKCLLRYPKDESKMLMDFSFSYSMSSGNIYGWKIAEPLIKDGTLKSIKDVENFYNIDN